ncbi:AAA family ATPase [Nakamurella sp. A5-74]|uniref:AAA family ATPase n=1 Tax=Nakamurella sp. A5-74 TaxID=3158264 RepID=A0AAU8DR35_9ACTN
MGADSAHTDTITDERRTLAWLLQAPRNIQASYLGPVFVDTYTDSTTRQVAAAIKELISMGRVADESAVLDHLKAQLLSVDTLRQIQHDLREAAPSVDERTVSTFNRAALVAEETNRLQIRADAQAALRRQNATERPPTVPLSELLAQPDEPVTYRVDRLLPKGGRAVLAAQFKAGKTTLVGNAIRALADTTPFLEEFTVDALDDGRRIVLIDNEMSTSQLRIWLRDQGIEHPERVITISLRGRVSTFDLLDTPTLQAWADVLRNVGAGFVIFDCLRPVLDALGLDESREAGRFLVAFDALLAAAGVDEAILVHHMGHTGERSRGDSRIRDWPDVEWRLVRQSAEHGDEIDPAAPRFFAAFGRDVDVPEGALTFDPSTRHLTLTGGNRRDVKAEEAVEDILAVLDESTEPLSGRAIAQRLAGSEHGRSAVRSGIRAGIRRGDILTEDGPRNAVLHYLNPSTASVRRSAPPVRQRAQSECASAPIGGALHSETQQEDIDDRATGALIDPCQTCHQPMLLNDGRAECERCRLDAAGGAA